LLSPPIIVVPTRTPAPSLPALQPAIPTGQGKAIDGTNTTTTIKGGSHHHYAGSGIAATEAQVCGPQEAKEEGQEGEEGKQPAGGRTSLCLGL